MSGAWARVLVGVLMVVVGAVLYFVFHDVETPVIGLRQVGVVVGVLGVLELVAVAWRARTGASRR
ncbi:hypothetical protein G3I59_04940 [Amycolatopsis rubida]|uniref:DUF3180 domain-containing protein n=1 Tax=Amycolatopsis rubida TaxID=112413 RepID=A0A1I6AN89_9PSEU|nr:MULTISPECIES: hypothetical protein [Amycolatopsis]MYW89982.1 hypothetical protein [Amycolatopsis rubida]NEC54959.1 hypothetical protein [Amycolatopsis rubida]OAP20273.1 hypothetical protein A4R44_09027 [Amycolatopsis sp. M39]SFQ70106.1 hypothetical protein SAMN05421854_12010 [Amycolatopsis rubida]